MKNFQSSVAKVNIRTPEIMARVQEQVERHYHSSLIERIRDHGHILETGSTTIRLATKFGFCYGVERAIDLAYAARKVFPTSRLFLIGEIIHNSEVNEHMATLGIRNLLAPSSGSMMEDLGEEDVVIVPAFGAEVSLLEKIKQRGCKIVDTTCGDVMSVWKRVKQNASSGITSIIHGKASHEETRATISRALGNGNGHYLVILNLEEADKICSYILGESSRELFFRSFAGRFSEGFDPDYHLRRIGVANQTTMLREETEGVQKKLKEAIIARDQSDINFRLFDTICGATQERQDALKKLFAHSLNLLLVVGGYNSSNTTHLAEMGVQKVPTYFIRNHRCLQSMHCIHSYDLFAKQEIVHQLTWLPEIGHPVQIGITAGASCPNNLIEEVILRLLDLREENANFHF